MRRFTLITVMVLLAMIIVAALLAGHFRGDVQPSPSPSPTASASASPGG